ncbi:MAG: hypothetical protein QOE98_3193 [Gaiellaceae bacterium]|jgi:bacterioferritin-associated ferredoxin|nr:hypothetical protein [Gaiellaceae bacterium]
MADKTFLCLCMDVTAADLDRAVREGFGHPEHFKRYTACFMGPCQAKSCMDTILAALAARTGTDAPAVRPTLRPPIHPVSIGRLAGLGVDDDGP